MIRLIIVSLLFLLSLFCVLKAPVYLLWFAAILVEEFPWIFIILEVVLLCWGIRAQRFQLTGNLMAAISLLLFLSPVIRAYAIASRLPEELQQTLGSKQSVADHPFEFSKMLTGINARKIPYQTMAYAKHDGTDLTLDFYPAQMPGKRPCVIVIHGGSWAAGDSHQLPELNSVLALKGYNVATINYRLAPRYKSPAPVEDVRDALKFLKKQTAIDTNHIVLLGRSAGAQIALVAAYSLNDPSIRGVVDFYGPADMVWGYSQPANPLIMDSRKVMEDYLGGTYSQVPGSYEASTANLYVTPRTVPTLLIHGKNDVLVFHEHSIRLSNILEKNSVKHYFLSLPWATHGCDYTLNGPSGQLSTWSVLYFLANLDLSE